MPKRKWKQRTLEEALRGVKARTYRKKKRHSGRDARTGIRHSAQPKPRGKRTLHTKESRKRPTNWLIVANDPNHPDWTPELQKKAWEQTAKAGRAGAEKRRGMPRGWRHPEWIAFWTPVIERSRRKVDIMEKRGLLGPEPEDEMGKLKRDGAKKALTFAIGVVDVKEHSMATQLQAAKMVLDFTMEKPVARKDVTVQSAEDFLLSLDDDDEDEEDKTG